MGLHTLHDCSEDIENIAKQPDNDEEDREAIGGGTAEVCEDLRRIDDDPAGD